MVWGLGYFSVWGAGYRGYGVRFRVLRFRLLGAVSSEEA